MFLKALNLTLAVGMIVGGVCTLRLVPKTQHIQAEVRRLEVMYGDAFVADPNKIYVRAIDSDKPFRFLWRVHLPTAPNYRFVYQFLGSGTGFDMSPRKNTNDMIVACTLRPVEGGIDFNLSGPGTFCSRVATKAGDLLFANPDKLQVTRAGEGTVREFSANQVFELLRVVPSSELVAEINAKYDEATSRQFSNGPMDIRLGIPAAFVKQQKKSGE